MKIIPSEKLKLVSALSISELEMQLKENIQTKRGLKEKYSTTNKNKIFEGTFSSEKFYIQKVIQTKNSFLPQINGTFKSTSNGTNINVELKLHSAVMVFLILLISISSIVSFFMFFNILLNGMDNIVSLVPFAILFFSIAMGHLGFNLDKKQTISDLKKMLKAKSIE